MSVRLNIIDNIYDSLSCIGTTLLFLFISEEIIFLIIPILIVLIVISVYQKNMIHTVIEDVDNISIIIEFCWWYIIISYIFIFSYKYVI